MAQNNRDLSEHERQGGDPSDETRTFDRGVGPELSGSSGSSGSSQIHAEPDPTLFEQYQPRSLRSIVLQQRAARESLAAEAAKVILDGIEPPEFDASGDQVQALLDEDRDHRAPGGFDDDRHRHARYTAIRVQRVTPMGLLVTPGAQFIYALTIIMLLSGLIALASSTSSPHLILTAGIATPMLLPVCIWKWIRWLDSDPYYYRLLTSLGEDARNLLGWRLLWKRSTPK